MSVEGGFSLRRWHRAPKRLRDEEALPRLVALRPAGGRRAEGQRRAGPGSGLPPAGQRPGQDPPGGQRGRCGQSAAAALAGAERPRRQGQEAQVGSEAAASPQRLTPSLPPSRAAPTWQPVLGTTSAQRAAKPNQELPLAPLQWPDTAPCQRAAVLILETTFSRHSTEWESHWTLGVTFF